MAADSDVMGARIREAREQAGLTQVQVAETLGVKQQTVQKWEAGIIRPRAGRLTDLAQALGTTVDALMGAEQVRSASSASGTDLEWVRHHDPATWKFIVDTAKAARRRAQ